MAGLNPRDRSRSPRFPSYPLSEAVTYAGRIYDGVHRSLIDASTAFRLMGFSGRSGASATALGAVRQFGLIEGTGDNTRVSELALRVLEPSSSIERNEALRIAAREPEVFRSILDRFDERIPTADEPVRAFLIRELGFSKGGAEDCLQSLRKTVEYTEMLAGASVPTVIVDEENDDVDDADASNGRRDGKEKRSNGGELVNAYRIPLTRECVADIRFEGDVTSKAIARLILHIELMQEVWAED